jgi:hypothetical protein
VEGSCEHGNEPSGCIIFLGKFLSSWAIGGFSRRVQLHEWSEHVSRICLSEKYLLWIVCP